MSVCSLNTNFFKLRTQYATRVSTYIQAKNLILITFKISFLTFSKKSHKTDILNVHKQKPNSCKSLLYPLSTCAQLPLYEKYLFSCFWRKVAVCHSKVTVWKFQNFCTISILREIKVHKFIKKDFKATRVIFL